MLLGGVYRGQRRLCSIPNNAPKEYKAALGAVIGACAGDAAGATLEFSRAAIVANSLRLMLFRARGLISVTVPFHYTFGNVEWAVDQAMTMIGRGFHGLAPGQVTDDSEEMICLLKGLVDGGENGEFALDQIALNYAQWYVSGPFDIGITTRSSIDGAFATQHNQGREATDAVGLGAKMLCSSQHSSDRSQANGSLMRCTPLGVWGHKLSFDDLATAAMLDSELTHCHLNVRYCVAAYSIIVAQIVHMAPQNRISLEARRQVVFAMMDWLKLQPGSEAVLTWTLDAVQGQTYPFFPQAGFVKKAYNNAVYHLFHGSTFEQTLKQTLMKGGDTDTNAAIACGLVGAAETFDNIPTHMSTSVLSSDHQQGLHRRPQYHPQQAPHLIKRLLIRAPSKLNMTADLSQLDELYTTGSMTHTYKD